MAQLIPEGASSTATTALVKEVTVMARAPNSNILAAGYSDGSIGLWNLDTQECTATLKGHKRAVSCLRFNAPGDMLVSGSRDTDVVLWDVLSEAGLVRLKGHRDEVTDVAFIPRLRKVVTSSKDGLVKVWDLDTQHCCQTLTGFKAEVWSLDVDPLQRRLVTGATDNEIRVYGIQGWEDLDLAEAGESGSSVLGKKRKAGAAEEEEGEGGKQGGVSYGTPPQVGDNAAAMGEILKSMGIVKRSAHERVGSIRFSTDGQFLACQSVGKSVEFFRVLGRKEATRKLKRRLQRRREKLAKKQKMEEGKQKTKDGGSDMKEEEADDDEKDEEEEEERDLGGGGGSASSTANEDDFAMLRATDELEPMAPLACKHKVKAICWHPRGESLPHLRSLHPSSSLSSSSAALLPKGSKAAAALPKGAAAQVVVTLSNNTVEVVNFSAEDGTPTVIQQLDAAGHRSDIRAVALSSDDRFLVSCSNAAVKIWAFSGLAGGGGSDFGGSYSYSRDYQKGMSNGSFTRCLSTMASGYGLSVLVAPGNKHVVIGTKEGTLEVFDLGSAERIQVESDAHKGPVWSLTMLPDKSGFISGSADKTIKFWSWAVVASGGGGGEVGGSRALRVTLTKTLEMSDDVLCVRCSRDGKLLAASLLDTTIKIYYLDSLKFFLSLYGHKLPALALDISDDSSLLLSGGADKNLRVWGLDFGDCHKSLFAHNDAVTTVAFVPNTHYAFSGGKDGAVKYWDLDRNEMLLELKGHHGEVWSLAVSAYGDKVFTASHDRSIRRWERTNEPFFVEEEKEKRLESLFEADVENQQNDDQDAALAAAAAGEEGMAAAAGRKTLESVSAADAIVDALEIAANEVERLQEAYAREEEEAMRRKRGGGGGSLNDMKKSTSSKLSTVEILAAAAAAKEEREQKKSALFAFPGQGNNDNNMDDEDEGDLKQQKSRFLKNKAAALPAPNPVMLGLSPSAFVLRAVSRVKANDLEQALLMLSFADAVRLLGYVTAWIDGGGGNNIELATRVAALLVRLHLGRLKSTPAAKPVLLRLFAKLRLGLAALKDTVGQNTAAIRMFQRQIKELKA